MGNFTTGLLGGIAKGMARNQEMQLLQEQRKSQEEMRKAQVKLYEAQLKNQQYGWPNYLLNSSQRICLNSWRRFWMKVHW